MTLLKYFKYLVYIFMVLYGLIGAIITVNDKTEYFALSCSNTLVASLAITSTAFLIGGITLGSIQLTADYQERHFDIIDALDEHYYVNMFLVFTTLIINLWGTIELIISSCASNLDMFHVGTGVVVMFWALLIANYILIPSLKSNMVGFCKKKEESYTSSAYYQNSWNNKV